MKQVFSKLKNALYNIDPAGIELAVRYFKDDYSEKEQTKDPTQIYSDVDREGGSQALFLRAFTFRVLPTLGEGVITYMILSDIREGYRLTEAMKHTSFWIISAEGLRGIEILSMFGHEVYKKYKNAIQGHKFLRFFKK